MTAPQTPPVAPSMPPKKKHRKWPWAFLAVVVLIVIIVVSTSSGGGGSSTPAANKAAAPPAAAPQQQAPKAAGIGQPVRDGKFEFTITKIGHASTVGDTQYGLGQKAQGQFTLLHLTVKNIGGQPQTLFDSNQYVYDSAGHKYSASSEADVAIATANGDTSGGTWLQNINPGNTVSGVIAFDMPAGVQAMKAELHDSMFSNGATVALH